MKSFIFAKRKWLVALFLLAVCIGAAAYYLAFVYDEDPLYTQECTPQRRAAASARVVSVASQIGYTPDKFYVEYEDRRIGGCRRVFVFLTDDPADTAHSPSIVENSLDDVGTSIAKKYGKLSHLSNLIEAQLPIQCTTWFPAERLSYINYCTTKGSKWKVDTTEIYLPSNMVILHSQY